jgi:hypothetical protein
MKPAILVLFIFLTLTMWPQTPTIPATQKPEELAQKSARAWLSLTDAGKYAESWDEAAAYFKHAVAKDRWVNAMKSTRAPLGAVRARKFKGATYTRTLPGVPDGEYMVIQYDTRFENKESAVETITPMLDKDGTWRVSGYYIK